MSMTRIRAAALTAMAAAVFGLSVATAGSALAFNPQPDPPGRQIHGPHAAFNPQPDPPGLHIRGHVIEDPHTGLATGK
jgi:hypothetical protein